MARSLRSSKGKFNKSRLRSSVFGPVEQQRKERLSSKLLELATNSEVTAGKESIGGENEPGTRSSDVTLLVDSLSKFAYRKVSQGSANEARTSEPQLDDDDKGLSYVAISQGSIINAPRFAVQRS